MHRIVTLANGSSSPPPSGVSSTVAIVALGVAAVLMVGGVLWFTRPAQRRY